MTKHINFSDVAVRTDLPGIVFAARRHSDDVDAANCNFGAAMQGFASWIDQVMTAAENWGAPVGRMEVDIALEHIRDSIQSALVQLQTELEIEEGVYRPTMAEEHSTYRVVAGRVA